MGGSKRFGSPKGLSSQIRLQGKRSMEIRIDETKADFEAYAYRDDLDGETVKRYQQIIDDLPPVDVFNTEEGLILAGGYHRLEAHRQEGRETITANIHLGTVVEAKMFACKANAQHGLNMTASERKRSRRDFIKFNLERDPLMSNYDIARSYGGCNARTIQRDRKALEAGGEIEATTQRRGADGKTYDVNNIGGRARTNDLAEHLPVENAQVNQIETLPEVLMRYNGEPIRNEADLIRAVDKTPLVRQVTKWDNFTTKVSQAHISLVNLIDEFGLESVSDMLREEEMDSDMLKVRHFWAKIEEVLTSLEVVQDGEAESC